MNTTTELSSPQLQKRKSNIFTSSVVWVGLFFITMWHVAMTVPSVLFRKPDGVHKVAIKWGRRIASFSGTRIHVRNVEKLYKDGPVIILPNHQSLFDIAVLYTFLDLPFRWMAKAVLFRIPFFGWAMAGADYIPVERGDSKKALKSMFEAAELIQSGKSVIIFPEGTRGGPDGVMLPFKKGAFLLAKKAAVTIQPIVLWGNQYIIHKNKDHLIQRFYAGDAFAEVLDPIAPSDFANLKSEELSQMLRQRMEEGLQRVQQWEREVLTSDQK